MPGGPEYGNQGRGLLEHLVKTGLKLGLLLGGDQQVGLQRQGLLGARLHAGFQLLGELAGQLPGLHLGGDVGADG